MTNVKVRMGGGAVIEKYPEEVRRYLLDHYPNLDTAIYKVSAPVELNSLSNQAIDNIVSMLVAWGQSKKMPLFILINYEFQNYLKNVCWPRGMQVTCESGDFDILVIGMCVGIILIEVKAVKRGCQMKNVKKNVRKACNQLKKYELVLKEMNRDWRGVSNLPITKIIGLPLWNVDTKKKEIKLSQLDICEKHQSNILTGKVLTSTTIFSEWIENIVNISPPSAAPVINYEDYQILCERFVGVASVVDVHSPPQINKMVSDSILKAFLTKAQKDLLQSSKSFLAFAGDYGTGKSLLLVEKALHVVRPSKRKQPSEWEGEMDDLGLNTLLEDFVASDSDITANNPSIANSCKSLGKIACTKKNASFSLEAFETCSRQNKERSKSSKGHSAPSGSPVENSNLKLNLKVCKDDDYSSKISPSINLAEFFTTANRKEDVAKEVECQPQTKLMLCLSASQLQNEGQMFDMVPETKSRVFLISCTDVNVDGKKCDLKYPELSVQHLRKMLRNDPRGIYVSKFGPFLLQGLDTHPLEANVIDVDPLAFLQAVENIVKKCNLRNVHLLLDEVPLNLVTYFRSVFEKLRKKPYMKTLWMAIATHSYRVRVHSKQDPKWIADWIPASFDFEYLTVNFRSPGNVLKLHRKIEEHVGDGHVDATHGKTPLGPRPLLFTLPECTCNIDFNNDHSPLNCECSLDNMKQTLNGVMKKIGDLKLQDIAVILFSVEHYNLHIQVCDLLEQSLTSLGFSVEIETTYCSSGGKPERQHGTVLIADEVTFVGCESSVLICVDLNRMMHWYPGSLLSYTTLGVSRCLSQYVHLTWPERESKVMYEMYLQEYEEGINANDKLSDDEKRAQLELVREARGKGYQQWIHKLVHEATLLDCEVGIHEVNM